MEAMLVKIFFCDMMTVTDKRFQAPGRMKMSSSSGSKCSLLKHCVLLTYNTASYHRRSESQEQKLVDESEK
jgi:hypothetical protein